MYLPNVIGKISVIRLLSKLNGARIHITENPETGSTIILNVSDGYDVSIDAPEKIALPPPPKKTGGCC